MAGLLPILTVADFLTQYGGMIIQAFTTEQLVSKTVQTRTISNGKSATFPVYGAEEAKLHTPGNDLFAASPDFAMDGTVTDQVINIDKLLVAPKFVDDLNDAMAHYDVRAAMAVGAGEALATALERWCVGALGKAAVASSNDTVTTGAYASMTGANIAIAIQDTAQAMDEAKIPKKGRYLVITPNEFYKLASLTTVISTDYGSGFDQNSRVGFGSLWYMGFEILNSAIMAEFDNTAAATQIASGGPLYFGGTTERNTNSFAGLKVYGIAYHSSAIGVLQLKGITTEMTWEARNQGHLIVAKRAIGVGAVRPTAAWTLSSTT